MTDSTDECVVGDIAVENHLEKDDACEILKGGECDNVLPENGVEDGKTHDDCLKSHESAEANQTETPSDETCVDTTNESLQTGTKRKSDDDGAEEWKADEIKKVKSVNDDEITEPITETGVSDSAVSLENKDHLEDEIVKKVGDEAVVAECVEASS